jgi:hypothetical protein
MPVEVRSSEGLGRTAHVVNEKFGVVLTYLRPSLEQLGASVLKDFSNHVRIGRMLDLLEYREARLIEGGVRPALKKYLNRQINRGRIEIRAALPPAIRSE